MGEGSDELAVVAGVLVWAVLGCSAGEDFAGVEEDGERVVLGGCCCCCGGGEAVDGEGENEPEDEEGGGGREHSSLKGGSGRGAWWKTR